MIKGFSIFSNTKQGDGIENVLKPFVAQTFAAICSIGEDKNAGETQIHNKRLVRPALKKYLARRYNSRLAGKICCLIDWSVTPMDYNAFYR